jgi:hypothetical protein
MPQELMEFMRHSSMQVTLDYYVGQRAMETASSMWAIHTEQGRKQLIGQCGDEGS